MNYLLLILLVVAVVVIVILWGKMNQRTDQSVVSPPKSEEKPPETSSPPQEIIPTDDESGKTMVFTFPSLFVTDPHKRESTYRLEFEEFRIGKNPESSLVVPTEGISDLEAKISFDSIAHCIVDVAGNGNVKVNGVGTDKHKLENGDEISIGGYSIKFTT